eukprot:1876133-Amphidinium_carterae.1
MKTAIVDENYIDYMLHERGLGHEDEEAICCDQREIDRKDIERSYERCHRTYPTQQRNTCSKT